MTDSAPVSAGIVRWDAEEYETLHNDVAQELAYNDTAFQPLTPFTYSTVSEKVILRLTFRWSEARG